MYGIATFLILVLLATSYSFFSRVECERSGINPANIPKRSRTAVWFKSAGATAIIFWVLYQSEITARAADHRRIEEQLAAELDQYNLHLKFVINDDDVRVMGNPLKAPPSPSP